MKQLTTLNNVSKEFAAFQINAGVRPSFNPEVPQFGYEGTSYGTPIIQRGTFFDLLMSPLKQKTKLKDLKKQLAKLTAKEDKKAQSANGKARGAGIKQPVVSSIPYFNDIILRFIETAIDEAVPEGKRKIADKKLVHGEEPPKPRGRPAGGGRGRVQTDDEKRHFGEGNEIGDDDNEIIEDAEEDVKAPRDVFRYYHKALSQEFIKAVASKSSKLGKRVTVRRAGDKWRMCLPLGTYKPGAYMYNDIADTALPRSEIAAMYKATGDFFKKAGINVFNLQAIDEVVRYKAIADVAKHVVDDATLNQFIHKYVVGYRVIADSAPKSSLDAVASRPAGAISNPGLGGSGGINIVDETQTITPEMENELNNAVDYDIQDREAATNLNLFRDSISREFKFYLVVDLPDEEARYYVQAIDAADIRPNQILEYFRVYYANCLYPIVSYFFPMEEVAKKIQGFEQKPKVNDGNISIDKNNNIYYIPTVNNIELVNKVAEDYTTRSTGEYSYDTSLDGKPNTLPKDNLPFNRILLTDWVNNKLSYTDSEGVLKILDMEDFYSARPYSMLRILNARYTNFMGITARSPIYFYEKGVENAFGIKFSDMVVPKLKALVDELAGKDIKFRLASDEIGRKIRAGLSLSDYVGIAARLTAFIRAVEDKIFRDMDMVEVFNVVVNENFTDESQKAIVEGLMAGVAFRDILDNDFGSPLAEYLDSTVEKCRADIERFCLHSVTNVELTLNAFALFYVVSVYRSKSQELRIASDADRNKYKSLDVDKGMPGYKPVLKNVGNNNGDGILFKNYQNRIMSVLDKTPPFAIIAVDAGGGKTILAISDCIQEMQKGTIKRPLILCPSHLVKDYVKETNWFTEGKMNCIVLTNFTLENYGQEQLGRLVKEAPINTIFIADYGVFSLEPTVKTYGSDSVTDYRYMNFFRNADFDYVCCDESHFLKNVSQREAAVRLAIAEIPIKRLMTGTFTPNKVKDIIRQFAFFDPSVFGSETQFEAMLENNEGRVPETIRNLLSEHSCFIQVKRREWAASLPHRIQSYLPPVSMTENQTLAYKFLCTKVQRKMEDFIKKVGGDPDSVTDNYKDESSSGDDGDDDDNSGDDVKRNVDEGDAGSADGKKKKKIQKQLEAHLADVEVFLAAPELHPYARIFLKTEADKISPKLVVVEKHIRDHLASKVYGKILVFTSWKLSAEHLYKHLPADIKEMTLRYYATDKVALVEEFKESDKYKVMIGIGRSMNTGLNLQFCSRLIFCESMWTPGELEQSLARIFRPVKPGAVDPRRTIWINHVIVDKTIDVNKMSNLVAKWVDVTMLNNYDNPIYAELEPVEAIPINIEKLSDFEPSFQSEEFEEHGRMFQTLLRCEQDDFDDFLISNPDKIDATPIVDGGLMAGSKQLSKIPYTPGMTLFSKKDSPLNLIPYTVFKSDWIRSNPDKNWSVSKFYKDKNYIVVHTEVGEGYAFSEGQEKTAKVIRTTGQNPNPFGDDTESDDVTDFSKIDFSNTDDQEEIFGQINDELIKQHGSESAADDAMRKQIDDLTGGIEEVDFSKKSSKANVKVKFFVKDLEYDPEALHAVTDIVEEADGTYLISFNPDTIFVITSDFSIATDDVRNTILSQVHGIPIQEVELKFDPTKKTGTEESVREKKRLKDEQKAKSVQKKINRMSAKDAEEEAKRAARKAKQEERQRRAAEEDDVKTDSDDGDDDEGVDTPMPRGRGRPPGSGRGRSVVPQEDEVQNKSINLYVAAAKDSLGLFADADDPDFDPVTLNRVMESKFQTTGNFTAIQPRTTDKYRDFMDWLIPAIYDDAGEFVGYVTKDTPVIKHPDKLKQKGRWMVDRTGERIISVEDFESGLYVTTSADLPKVEVTDESREMLEKSYEQMAFSRGRNGGTIIYTNISPSHMALLDRLSKKRVPPGQISIYPVVVRGKFFLCIDEAINSKGVITEVVKAAKAQGFVVLPKQREAVAYYPNKAELGADIKNITRKFKVGNIEALKEAFNAIKARGRPTNL